METVLVEKAGPVDVGNGFILNASDHTQLKCFNGFEPAKVVTLNVDSSEAFRICEECNNWPGQRKLESKRIAEYERKLKQKLWHSTVISIARIVDNKRNPVMVNAAGCIVTNDSGEAVKQKLYLLNGQHTLHALSGVMGVMNLTFNFYDLTEEEVATLFSQFDDHKNKKQVDAILPLAIEIGVTEKKSRGQIVQVPLVPPSIVELIGRAIYWVDTLYFDPKCQRPTKDVIISTCRTKMDFIKWLVQQHSDPAKPFRPIENEKFSWLWRLGTIASIYKIWSVQDENSRVQLASFLRSIMDVTRSYEAGNPVDELIKVYRNAKTDVAWKGLLVPGRACLMFLTAFDKFCEVGDTGVNYDLSPLETLHMTDAEITREITANSELDAVGTNVRQEAGTRMLSGRVDQRLSVAE